MMQPELLPHLDGLRRITQSLAMLDAILSQEWEYRYFSFNAAWAPGEAMASMRNGLGDDWFLLFDPAGAALKGFAHELARDPLLAGAIQQQVPQEFSSFLQEPAFSMQNASFCYWLRAGEGAQWQKVESSLVDDGSDWMLGPLISGPNEYKAYAEDYFEVSVPLELLEAIFAHQPLDSKLVRELNPDADVEQVFVDATEIGYPQAVPEQESD
jgi:hypothetical protein